MDDFDLVDDDSFAEDFLQAASQVESQARTPVMLTCEEQAPLSKEQAPLSKEQAPLSREQDDSLDDVESASQARERASRGPATPCPPRIVDMADDDQFGISDDEDEFLAACEAVESNSATGKHALSPDESHALSPDESHALSPDESRPTKRTMVEAIGFRQTLSALKYVPHVGEVDFGEPDFQDRHNLAALELVAQQARTAGLPMTAELQAILRNAFTAGHMSQHRAWKRRYTFDFLTLPAEIRLNIYKHALLDTNPTIAGRPTQALPTRKKVFMDWLSDDTLSHGFFWLDGDEKPWINLALLRTCKQVYREVRDEFLYQDRHFDAKAVLDENFKDCMKLSPTMTFWQHIQHIHLILRPVDNATQWARHVHKGVDSLTALLRGGKKLKSFQLSWQFTQFSDHIKYFGSLRVSASIVITQHFDDATVKDGQALSPEREERIWSLMKTMQGLQPNADVEYDCVISQTSDSIGPVRKRSEMQIRMSTQ